LDGGSIQHGTMPRCRDTIHRRKKLTRRANHRHNDIIASIEPAPGNWPRVFVSDGGRIHDGHAVAIARYGSLPKKF
jgi:hypothetical protein